MTRNDYHRRVSTRLAQLFQRLQAVDAWQPNVEQDAIVGAALNGFQAVFTTGDRVDRKPFVAHHSPQRLAYPTLVVNY
jgi:hypothetical protein